ncbi:MAG: polyphosphate:AMP phosphotransferase [Acidobacteria bacterium]|nr:polyphosphate:AMP phosphotransferase [Acidobacteriota bacterium]
MFESAEIGHKIDKQTYSIQVPELRASLVEAQYELNEARQFPVIVVVAGVEFAGRGEVINTLNEWMDPRHIQVHASRAATSVELEYPTLWRFWQDLPPKGKIGMFFGSWYTPLFRELANGNKNTADWERAMERIIRFEKMLADEGAVIVKFWLHLSQDALKKRIKKLGKHAETKWKVANLDPGIVKNYQSFKSLAESVVIESSRAHAPWIVVESSQPKFRNLTVGTALLQAIRSRLKHGHTHSITSVAPIHQPLDQLGLLDTLNLDCALDRNDYKQQLKHHQGRLHRLAHHKKFQDLSVVLVFEGNDAAGKGGAIRRVTGALDVRQMKIHPISAPTDEELAQPFLWRFWRRLPRRGRIAVFDRSWYGRVLVERVEGYCGQDDWMRAYSEINEFEEELSEANMLVIKFWLAISKDEQLKRFKEREHVRFKKFKITPDDWRNREKWDAYVRAVNDMIDRTSTAQSPWVLVEANNKWHARVKVVKTIADRLEDALR